MASRQPQDYGLDDSSDLEDSWAAESVMFDTSPASSKYLQNTKRLVERPIQLIE